MDCDGDLDNLNDLKNGQCYELIGKEFSKAQKIQVEI